MYLCIPKPLPQFALPVSSVASCNVENLDDIVYFFAYIHVTGRRESFYLLLCLCLVSDVGRSGGRGAPLHNVLQR